jgi:hypothetical protein
MGSRTLTGYQTHIDSESPCRGHGGPQGGATYRVGHLHTGFSGIFPME